MSGGPFSIGSSHCLLQCADVFLQCRPKHAGGNLGIRVQGLGIRVLGLGFRDWGLGFRGWGWGFGDRV